MVSAALQHKIAQQKVVAPLELPKARLCASVVLASLSAGTGASGGADLVEALVALKAGLGQKWSAVTAIQYISGRQAEFAAECGLPHERAGLLWAHFVAKALADGVQPLGGFSSAHVIALKEQAQGRLFRGETSMSCVYEELAICVVYHDVVATGSRAGGTVLPPCACFLAPSSVGDLTLEK